MEAVRFLTVLPVPASMHFDSRMAARSVGAFPTVGLIIGLIAAAVGWVAHLLWGPPLPEIAIVLCWVVVTGGLHLDGVADSCDGLFSWRDRQRKLEIMRDSRLGVMGGLGLIVALMLKAGALSSLGPMWWVGAVTAPMWGRWSSAFSIHSFPAAREQGLGQGVRAYMRPRYFAVATLSAVAIALLVTGPLTAIITAAFVWLVVRISAAAIVRSLGGLTGDTDGLLSELGEVTSLVVLSALYHHELMSWPPSRW